jgi:alpha-tubulin suppressor-like RCC1 family protein
MKFSFSFSAVLMISLFACGDDSETQPRGAQEVELRSPAANDVTPGPTVEVEVRLWDNQGIASAVLSAGSRGVVIDLASLDARGEGRVQIELPEGKQTLRLLAVTGDGRTATAERDLIVDSTEPTAEILSPAPGALVVGPTFPVRVRVSDAIGLAGAVLFVGEDEYPIAPHTLDGNGEATVHVTSAGGVADLGLLATDRAGHQRTVGADVAVDVAAPSADVLAPRADVAETRRLLFAQFSDESGVASVSYTLNGGAAHTVTPEPGATSVTLREVLELSPGANQLAVSVTDRAGRVSEKTIDFRYGLVTAAGGAHSGAVTGGQLFTWGRYNVGQLGLGGALGDAESRLSPNLVAAFGAEGTEVASIAFNQNHSIAVRSDRTVWTWGGNGDGQLGQGDAVQRSVPTQISGLTDVVYATAGYSHALALRADGAVLAWGKNASGQIGVMGDGTTADDQPTPVVVEGLPANIVKIIGGSEHSIALTADGRVFAWGRNQYGNLGNGGFDTERHPVPAAVAGLTDVIDVASGRDHILAVRADGTVATWGLGASGQLGYGEPANASDADRASPVTALTAADQPLTAVRAVFANGNTSFAILATAGGEELWGWGQNFNGQLALARTSNQEWLARRVVIYTDAEPPTYLDQVAAIQSMGVGATHVIGKSKSGSVFAWGWSFRGSLGVPTLANLWAQTIALEVAIPALTGASASASARR